MAFRRTAVEEVGFFDEQIQYGFDEVEFADRICRAGYKMVLDPEVSVWHKHRSTFKEFLKQNFQYGKGSGLVFKKKILKDSVSKWTFLAIIGFIIWVSNSWNIHVPNFNIKFQNFLMDIIRIHRFALNYCGNSLHLQGNWKQKNLSE